MAVCIWLFVCSFCWLEVVFAAPNPFEEAGQFGMCAPAGQMPLFQANPSYQAIQGKRVRNLRIGAIIRMVLPALAHEIVRNFNHGRVMESQKEMLQGLSAAVIEAYNMLPNLDLLILSVMTKGVEFSSATLLMVPGIPIKPMLANYRITNGVPQVLKLFHEKALYLRIQRAQIHKLSDGSVRVFSRNETTQHLGFLMLMYVSSHLVSCSPMDIVGLICDTGFNLAEKEVADGCDSDSDTKETEFDRFEFASSSDVKEVTFISCFSGFQDRHVIVFIAQERLEREYSLSLITTAQSVVYRVYCVGGEMLLEQIENLLSLQKA
ncbi:DNA LIGASE 6 [Artemisia annua]|uniref:DNA LIGASE 6 n=1 Tax=Artemisia annua TaxID=35608 RepID=A0A2U1NK62_ARTAN|nr:DNA LIGASE 6 [Artemisia annua]